MTATPTRTPRMLGQPIKRREDPRLITGAGAYLDDLTFPGMLHLAVVRSPYGHARVNSIDTLAARSSCPASSPSSPPRTSTARPPARSPTSSAGTPFENVNDSARCPLATDKVRYVGDPVAVVVAETRYGARDAAAAGRSRLRAAAGRGRPREGARAGRAAPLRGVRHQPRPHPDPRTPATSTAPSPRPTSIVKLRVVNQRVIPLPMETRGALAIWRPDGDATPAS